MSSTLEAKIEGYHVQPDRKIKTSALLRLFQKSAAMDLANFNISDVDMHNNNVAFVLSRMTVQMYKDIYFDDLIEIVDAVGGVELTISDAELETGLTILENTLEAF